MSGPQDGAEINERLARELVLWHSHGGFAGHTHDRGDVWHVHRIDITADGHAVWQTVWEDGDHREGYEPLS